MPLITAIGWTEPVPGWELHPLDSIAFHGALLRHLTCGDSLLDGFPDAIW